MGQAAATNKRISNDRFEGGNMEHIFNLLPDDLLFEILLHVDARTLIKSCTRLCVRVHGVLQSKTFWIEYCIADNVTIPPLEVRREDSIALIGWQCLALGKPLGKNLINNPCARQGLDQWECSNEDHYARSKWQIENPGSGCEPHPNDSIRHCFVSSYTWCEKQQTIDLFKHGLHPTLLKNVPIKIDYSEDYVGRFDCGGEFELKVNVLDEQHRIIQESKKETRYEGGLQTEWTTLSGSLVIESEAARYIVFISRAKDTQFWAGNYGPKLTNAQLVLQCT